VVVALYSTLTQQLRGLQQCGRDMFAVPADRAAALPLYALSLRPRGVQLDQGIVGARLAPLDLSSDTPLLSVNLCMVHSLLGMVAASTGQIGGVEGVTNPVVEIAQLLNERAIHES
jgi:hypothetical protein